MAQELHPSLQVAHVRTVAFQGIDVKEVDVQVQIGAGLPSFAVVGLFALLGLALALWSFRRTIR